ncbi:IS5 family transposase [Spirosoma sp. BT702]|uniref:IS5 family transposase n=1 Tax=Spirosoma profusum TaxID=2771354 RepID=A0A926XY60_9BACT|nr:IS5 family transposase [Spirosoma profusum]MBD2699978.1 IS5 family transposase [Spirosoma profusum]
MPTCKTKHKTAKKYPHELSNQQWKQLKKLVPQPKKQAQGPGRNPLDLRQVINAILYVMRSGCSWAVLPNDYPNYKSVYHYYNSWSKAGYWQEIHVKLVTKVHKKTGRKKRPTASAIDSQSIKTTQIGGEEGGFDAGKLVKGHKRFILVNTLGLLLAVKVVAASVSQKAGAKLLIEKIWANCLLKELCGKLELVWVDAGYSGDDLYDWIATLTGWLWEVVKRSDSKHKFVLLPRRWVVERSFSWLSFHRRLLKDYEKLTRNSESTLYISMLPMMLRRLN